MKIHSLFFLFGVPANVDDYTEVFLRSSLSWMLLCLPAETETKGISTVFHRVTESVRVERASKTIESNL